MRRWDEYATMKFAREEGVEEGIGIGVEKGIDIGVEKGIVIGEARNEAKNALRTAKKMKAKGLNTALIAEITGLSEDEIDELKLD